MSERMNFLLKYQRKHFGLLSVVLLLVVEWFLHAVCLTSILRASRDLPVHQLRSPGQNSRFYEFIKTDSANESFHLFLSLVQRAGTKVENIFREQRMNESIDTCI